MSLSPTGSGSNPSRVGQPDQPPITVDGRRYEQIVNGAALDLDQRTGYLAVFDAESGSRLHLVRVYDVPFDPDLEADVQDVFFTSMRLDDSGHAIIIENERGGRFSVDLDSLTVSALP